ncbi:hypothetical protein R1flu_025956 [Riccia fluitans]|uniref:Uncharacterized protein n=1 Tax=Riccia fluitans TaxID=41844 RepID=A0ABD1XEV5_9MARC
MEGCGGNGVIWPREGPSNGRSALAKAEDLRLEREWNNRDRIRAASNNNNRARLSSAAGNYDRDDRRKRLKEDGDNNNNDERGRADRGPESVEPFRERGLFESAEHRNNMRVESMNRNGDWNSNSDRKSDLMERGRDDRMIILPPRDRMWLESRERMRDDRPVEMFRGRPRDDLLGAEMIEDMNQ